MEALAAPPLLGLLVRTSPQPVLVPVLRGALRPALEAPQAPLVAATAVRGLRTQLAAAVEVVAVQMQPALMGTAVPALSREVAVAPVVDRKGRAELKRVVLAVAARSSSPIRRPLEFPGPLRPRRLRMPG
ncbi:hypothetical protein KLP38_05510 [Cupriavidus sp. EM10]|uniref:hypothetical protein n=1 Tax=Cupriavidus sp. EM10 TaxID=2839983 RepID=UPI001C001B3A|nr:hypothetical protein [Cupriavidus sp. EM10]QWE95351.1 hypothetical protein KLP38_05510 [Cupriavidus sp. EM10]